MFLKLFHNIHISHTKALSCFFLELVDSVNVVLGDALMQLTYGPPIWKLFRTKHYDDFDKNSEKISLILSNISKKSKEKIIAAGVTKEKDSMSVLEKLIDKCGVESKIPETMANDAMMAGIDTTGNSSAFLF